jgi:hypothetical protein
MRSIFLLFYASSFFSFGSELDVRWDRTGTVEEKYKVKLSLCFFNWAYWGVEYSSTHSLTLALDEGEWSASRPGPFTPR